MLPSRSHREFGHPPDNVQPPPRRAALLALCFVGLLGGCVNTTTTRLTPTPIFDDDPPPARRTMLLTPGRSTIGAEPAWPEHTPDLWQRMRSGFALSDMQHGAITAEITRLRTASTGIDALFTQSRPFLNLVLSAVEERGLPTELALLPAIESGFRPLAESPSGAVGLWQFMPATGQRFGLQEDWWFDGRRDPLSSTTAALDYLEYLATKFDGDWLLALAAYNAGDGTVSRAIRRNLERGLGAGYWALELPAETASYVPRLLALARVVADPDQSGLQLPALDDAPQVEVIDVEQQVDLRLAAQLAEVPVEEFLLLNAGYRRAMTRPDGPHQLLVPSTAAERLSVALADLPCEQEDPYPTRHLVRSGDTLSDIARRYGASVTAIKAVNGLASHLIHPELVLTIPPAGHDQP